MTFNIFYLLWFFFSVYLALIHIEITKQNIFSSNHEFGLKMCLQIKKWSDTYCTECIPNISVMKAAY